MGLHSLASSLARREVFHHQQSTNVLTKQYSTIHKFSSNSLSLLALPLFIGHAGFLFSLAGFGSKHRGHIFWKKAFVALNSIQDLKLFERHPPIVSGASP